MPLSFDSRPRSRRHSVVCLGTLATLLLLGLVLPARADSTLGFQVGLSAIDIVEYSQLGLTNTSSHASITSLTINLPGTTFFDTASPNPGALADRGWSIADNNGLSAIDLPSNLDTDGSQFATIAFTGFDPGDSLLLAFDLDEKASIKIFGYTLLIDVATSTIADTSVTVGFDTGESLTASLGFEPRILAGSLFFQTASRSVPYHHNPEPSALLAVLSGLPLLLVGRKHLISPR